MSLTKEQWFLKLKNWHPPAFIEEGSVREAYYKGLAALMNQVETDMEATQALTFFDNSFGSLLDTHGDERSVHRAQDEIDHSYRAKIKSFTASVAEDSIKGAIDDFLPASIEIDLFEPKRRGPFWGQFFFNTIQESFVLTKRRDYAQWFGYIPRIPFDVTTADVTIAVGESVLRPRITIDVGDTYTVSGVLVAYEIINNGTLVADTIAPGVVISGTGTTSTNGDGGEVQLLATSDYYASIDDTIARLKATGTLYHIYSEAFS